MHFMGLNLNPFAWRWTLISFTTFFLLWGTFFIEIQVPLLVGLLFAVGIIYVRLFGLGKMDKLGILLLANFFYWIISGLLTGGITPLDLLNIKLWNGDGRIVIGSMPLLLYSMVRLTHWELKHTINTMLWMGLIGIVLYMAWATMGVSWLAGAGHPDEFHAFLSSHTGAGTFFGCLATFTTLYGYEKKNWMIALLGLALIGPTFSSGSRESLVGIMAVMGWYLVIRSPKPHLIIGAALVGGLLFVTLPTVISQKTYERTYGLLQWSFITGMVTQAERAATSNWQFGDWNLEDEDSSSLEEGDGTTLVRIQLWVYAAKRIMARPMFGMGWGRFNDPHVHFIDASPFLSIGATGVKALVPSTAHNSYFQIGAESGLVGLVMYMSIWYILFRRCGRAIDAFAGLTDLKAYYVALQGNIVFILTCGLTGHALGSPSVMLPTMVLLGAGSSFLRGNLFHPSQVKMVPREAACAT